jgi:transcriptional regulator with XRE-family HTH domain
MVEMENKMPVTAEIGERLRQERKRHSLTQSACAEVGGVSVASQGLYESGERAPNATYLSYLYENGFDVCFILTGHRCEAEYAKSNLNTELLTQIIEAVEKYSAERTIPILPEIKAELVNLFYAQFAGDGKVDKKIIRGHLRLIK